ncbi:MAG: hypothetical protein HKP01_04550 [Gemmatimonadetes bacterium]|nr:hypothetical protein [Gemmatimonadota bacterium]
MPIRLRWLGASFLLALAVATPLRAQENPANSADRPTREVRSQRQDRIRVHQPGQRAEARARAENRVRRDGTAPGTRARSRATREGAAGNRDGLGARGSRDSRGSQVRDRTTGSRVQDNARRRDRVHRPAN